jgi:4-carboxymuconolactone decarboxylase
MAAPPMVMSSNAAPSLTQAYSDSASPLEEVLLSFIAAEVNPKIRRPIMAARSNPHSTINQVRDVFPKLGELTDKVVFGDVWERKQLSKRDRSLITVAALVALYRPDQLRGHLWRALENGVTREEIGEVITHLAFYAGWPNAGTAALIAKQVFEERD